MGDVYYIDDQELGVERERMSTLTVIEDAPSNAGTYLCLAENEAGIDYATAELTVHGEYE